MSVENQDETGPMEQKVVQETTVETEPPVWRVTKENQVVQASMEHRVSREEREKEVHLATEVFPACREKMEWMEWRVIQDDPELMVHPEKMYDFILSL